MRAVVYGGGNIGRGFLGQLLYQSGYETVFIDVNEEMIQKLNFDKCYPIKIVSNEEQKEILIKNVSAVNGNDVKAASDSIANCDIMFTSAGVNVLPFIAPVIAKGLEKRTNGLDVIICENLLHADKYLKELISKYTEVKDDIGFVEASVGRMVPIMNGEMYEGNILKVWVEPFCTLPVDKNAFKNEIPNIKGMLPSAPFEYYIQSKLYLHNMGHSITAYLGQRNGYEYIWQAIGDSKVREIVTSAMLASAHALSIEHNKPFEEVKAYALDLIQRFGNKALGDTVLRVGRDIKRKLAANDRLAGAAILCKKHCIDNAPILHGIAVALMFDSDDDGTKEVKSIIVTEGINSVLKKICGFEVGSYEYNIVEDFIK